MNGRTDCRTESYSNTGRPYLRSLSEFSSNISISAKPRSLPSVAVVALANDDGSMMG